MTNICSGALLRQTTALAGLHLLGRFISRRCPGQIGGRQACPFGHSPVESVPTLVCSHGGCHFFCFSAQPTHKHTNLTRSLRYEPTNVAATSSDCSASSITSVGAARCDFPFPVRRSRQGLLVSIVSTTFDVSFCNYRS
ncbi:hypothetical protein Mapa_015040 [Marchantia paleacea]|nr:hypothetical protein Mapa_015040 [Marchantia paleacea]